LFVDQHFVVSYAHELGPQWHLVDVNGMSTTITYNMDSDNPRITEGWFNMRNLYQIQSDSHIQFQYLGNCLFHLTVFKGGCTRTSWTTFMNRITHQNTRSIFSVKLSKYQSKASHLVYSFLFIIMLITIIKLKYLY